VAFCNTSLFLPDKIFLEFFGDAAFVSDALDFFLETSFVTGFALT
jgi:hypothetical protein